MKKTFSVMLAAMLALCSIAALAEEPVSTGSYLDFTIGNPVLYSGEEVVADLTGVSLKLALSHGEASGYGYINLTAGEDNSLTAGGELTGNSLVAFMDGLSSVYKIDLSQFSGSESESVNFASMVDIAALETALSDWTAQFAEGDFSSIITVGEAVEGVEREILGETYSATQMPFEMTAAQMQNLAGGIANVLDASCAQLLAYAAQAGEEVPESFAALLTGNIPEDASITGALYAAATEDGASLISFDIAIVGGESAVAGYLDMSMGETVDAILSLESEDGQSIEYSLSASDSEAYVGMSVYEGEEVMSTMTMSAYTDENGFRVVSLDLSAADQIMSFYHSTDNATERYASLGMYAGEECLFSAELATEIASDETARAESGVITISASGTSIVADVSIVSQAMDYASLIDTIDLPVVEVSTLDEEATTALQNEALTSLMTFYSNAVTNVPALGALINSLTGASAEEAPAA